MHTMEHNVTPTTDSEDIRAEQLRVMRFLVLHNFNQGSLGAIKNIALLIAKNLCNALGELKAEYALLCTDGEKPESVRAKLIYCAEHNHDALRESIHTAYKYDMGKFFGIKAFIEHASMAFSLFANA
jgi:hypothetical protein